MPEKTGTKRLLVVIGWIIGSFLTLSISFFTIHILTRTEELPTLIRTQIEATATDQKLITVSHLSGAVRGISTAIQTGDARPVLISQFLEKNTSPLEPYDYWGQVLTDIADKYGLDYRLLPAIAMQESNLCKKIPEDSFNCTGLGIHSRGTWSFETFETNFDKAGEILRRNYIDEGLITPEEIQSKYTPLSEGSWQFAINKFMDQLETAEF